MEAKKMLSVAVFLSGSGRTLENLLLHRDQHDLPIDVCLVISSRPNVRGLQIAEADGIPTQVVRKRDFGDADDYSAAMFQPVRQCGAEFVVMAGFLQHVLIPPDFEGRVINIHPSLLPAYGGHGMYGNHVHTAVIKHGEPVSGCTVHFVDNEYDQGPVLLQRTCDVLSNDTPDTLAARVFEEECKALPDALRTLVERKDVPKSQSDGR